MCRASMPRGRGGGAVASGPSLPRPVRLSPGRARFFAHGSYTAQPVWGSRGSRDARALPRSWPTVGGTALPSRPGQPGRLGRAVLLLCAFRPQTALIVSCDFADGVGRLLLIAAL